MASEKFAQAAAIWARYYVSTEEFDRTLPGTWGRGDPDCWIPFDTRPSNAYAKRQRENALSALREMEAAEELSNAAQEYVLRMSFDQQRGFLSELPPRQPSQQRSPSGDDGG